MKLGYKSTELGIIPNDWNTSKLKYIIKIGNGKDYKHLKSGDIPVYGSGGIIAYVNEYLFEGKTVGIGRKGNIDKPILLNGKFWTVDTLFYINEFIDVDVDFVYNLFQAINWLKYNEATGLPSLSKNNILNIDFVCPPLHEQKIIASCLNTWDTGIDLQVKFIEIKENRLKALTQQLITGKKRLAGFTQNWKEVKLGTLFNERNETKLEHLPLLSIGQEGVYPQTDSNKRDISNADKSKYKRIVPGDIGYNTMRMWQGRSALSSLEGIVSPAYTILVPKNNVNPYYFSILFKTSKLTNLFWRNSQGLVEDTLNCKYKDFSKIKYQVPSFEEQNAIAEILKTAEKEIQLEKQKLEELKEQKKGLMQQLLTGKVRLV